MDDNSFILNCFEAIRSKRNDVSEILDHLDYKIKQVDTFLTLIQISISSSEPHIRNYCYVFLYKMRKTFSLSELSLTDQDFYGILRKFFNTAFTNETSLANIDSLCNLLSLFTVDYFLKEPWLELFKLCDFFIGIPEKLAFGLSMGSVLFQNSSSELQDKEFEKYGKILGKHLISDDKDVRRKALDLFITICDAYPDSDRFQEFPDVFQNMISFMECIYSDISNVTQEESVYFLEKMSIVIDPSNVYFSSFYLDILKFALNVVSNQSISVERRVILASVIEKCLRVMFCDEDYPISPKSIIFSMAALTVEACDLSRDDYCFGYKIFDILGFNESFESFKNVLESLLQGNTLSNLQTALFIIYCIFPSQADGLNENFQTLFELVKHSFATNDEYIITDAAYVLVQLFEHCRSSAINYYDESIELCLNNLMLTHLSLEAIVSMVDQESKHTIPTARSILALLKSSEVGDDKKRSLCSLLVALFFTMNSNESLFPVVMEIVLSFISIPILSIFNPLLISSLTKIAPKSLLSELARVLDLLGDVSDDSEMNYNLMLCYYNITRTYSRSVLNIANHIVQKCVFIIELNTDDCSEDMVRSKSYALQTVSLFYKTNHELYNNFPSELMNYLKSGNSFLIEGACASFINAMYELDIDSFFQWFSRELSDYLHPLSAVNQMESIRHILTYDKKFTLGANKEFVELFINILCEISNGNEVESKSELISFNSVFFETLNVAFRLYNSNFANDEIKQSLVLHTENTDDAFSPYSIISLTFYIVHIDRDPHLVDFLFDSCTIYLEQNHPEFKSSSLHSLCYMMVNFEVSFLSKLVSVYDDTKKLLISGSDKFSMPSSLAFYLIYSRLNNIQVTQEILDAVELKHIDNLSLILIANELSKNQIINKGILALCLNSDDYLWSNFECLPLQGQFLSTDEVFQYIRYSEDSFENVQRRLNSF